MAFGLTYIFGTLGVIIFINNINNPINTLTVNEIRGIYSDKYTNWSELNGNNDEIISW